MATTKHIVTEVDIDVDIDLDDFDTDELIDEVEARGNWLVVDKIDGDFIAPRIQDEIYELYRDYISRSPSFEENLKGFFENYVGSIVH
jgi:hypothetical protein